MAFNTDTKLIATDRAVANEMNYKAHSEDGVHFLVNTSAAPVGNYCGFLVLTDAVISSITHTDAAKNGDPTSVGSFGQGLYITQPGGFTTMTLTSGKVMLTKYSPNKR